MLDAHIVKNLADGLIDYIVKGFGQVVKGGDRGKNMGAHVGGHDQQTQMPFVKRGFLTTRANLRFSFKVTSAALTSRFSL